MWSYCFYSDKIRGKRYLKKKKAQNSPEGPGFCSRLQLCQNQPVRPLAEEALASSPRPVLRNPKTNTKPKNFPERHEKWHDWPSGLLCERTQQPWLTTQIMMVTRDILAPKLLPEEGKKNRKKEKIQRRASSREKTHALCACTAQRGAGRSP